MPKLHHIITSHLTRKNSTKSRKKRKKNQNPLPKSTPPPERHVDYEEEEEEEVGVETTTTSAGFNLKPTVSCRNRAIQPLGNLLLHTNSTNSRNPGLGNLRTLTDDLVLDVLGLLCARDLGILSLVSKSFYVFSTHDPLWRNLVLQDLKGDFLFDGSWRSTYISSSTTTTNTTICCSSRATSSVGSLCITDFYSDYLFQSWLCASLEMKPEWLEVDNIQRRSGISVDEFVSRYEEPNRPVLLESCVSSWPAMRKWDREGLVRMCGDVKFAVGPVDMRLEDYFRYADLAREERPLYLFDPRFGEKVPEMGLDYEVPVYFREDLFAVLDVERPDYRWVIIGPAGSGSSFHVDPNSTSAWNAVIKGSKKWVMFPPDVVPPGVHPSPDGADVACPVSIIEWFMNFYGACRELKKRPVECVCKSGDVLFVPNGWWHLVINLEDSVAITQNYVSRRNLLNVLDFLKRPNASELVSGTSDRVNLFDKFRSAIESTFPGTIEELTLKAQEKMTQQRKPTFWESVTDTRAGGFKFSF